MVSSLRGLPGGRSSPGRSWPGRWTPLVLAFVLGLTVGVGGILTFLPGGTTPPRAQPSPSGTDAAGFAPTSTYHWVDGPTLGVTATGEQWASTDVTRIVTKNDCAGFHLLTDPITPDPITPDRDSGIRVAISGTEWKVEEPVIKDVMTGEFSGPPHGTLAVSVSASGIVTITYNGRQVTRYQLKGHYTDRGIRPTVWQSNPGVRLTGIRTNVTAWTNRPTGEGTGAGTGAGADRG